MSAPTRNPRLLVTGRYAHLLPEAGPSLDEVLTTRHGRRVRQVADRVPPLRGLLAFLAAADYDGTVLLASEPGALTLLWLEGFLRRRRGVVVLELLARGPARARWRGLLRRAWERAIQAPALRRGMLAGQTLTAWERETLTRAYGLEPRCLCFVPWPWRIEANERIGLRSPRGTRRVLVSGYAHVDWPTAIDAACGRDWELTLVCGARERTQLESLAPRGARVLCDLSRDEHQRLVEAADVYVLSLLEAGTSTGHVRLMAANQAGVPVVATRVRGLEGYVVDGATALLIPAGAPEEMGEAVDRVLADARLAATLATGARERSRRWTYADYRAALLRLARGECPPAPR